MRTLAAHTYPKLTGVPPPGKETVSFPVEAATTGWVGFGFSSGNDCMMIGSDVVIGWVKDSKGYLTVRITEHVSHLQFYFNKFFHLLCG